MRVYRLTKKKFSRELSGVGAAKFGNRWNSKGIEMVYTSGSRALAMAELVVHLTLKNLPSGYVMLEIDIPNTIPKHQLKKRELAGNWNSNPPSFYTQQLGNEFIRNMKHCVMEVPSAVVPGDSNFLLNPFHADFKKIKIIQTVEFPFDNRLFC